MAYYKLEVNYFNSFWLKKTIYTGTPGSLATSRGVPYDYNNFAIVYKSGETDKAKE